MEHMQDILFAEQPSRVAAPSILEGEGILSQEEINKLRVIDTPQVQRASWETLAAMASKLTGGTSTLAQRPVMDISTRKPYEEAGLMDFYKPGRWDSTSNSVYMVGIKLGPSPGQWDGTVGYLQFKAPKDGTYLIVAHFTGYQITMKLGGPWGVTTGTTGTTSEPGTVTAIYTGKANTWVFFNLTCVYPNLAFLNSVQVYPFN